MKSTRIRNIRRGWIAAAIAMVLGLLCAGVCSAYPAIDPAAPVALTVSAAADGKAISGLRLTLYKAADMQVTGNGTIAYTVNDAFAQYNNKIEAVVDPNEYDSSDWAQAAANLEAHVKSDDKASGGKVFESYSQVTGADGTAVFTGLGQGLYLMVGTYEGSEYSSVLVTPAFLTLPQWSEKTSSWSYDAHSNAKPKATKNPTKKTTSVTAKKVWSGDSAPSKAKKRPTSVTVQLVNEAGSVVSEAELNTKNGWTHTWTGLSEGKWSVKEKSVPKNYSVSYEEKTTEQGLIVTVKNTTPPGGVLGESREKPKESESETDKKSKKKKNVRGTSREGDTQSEEGALRLPQTGQLWWPVWLLSGIAAVLVIIGLILRLSGKKDLKE